MSLPFCKRCGSVLLEPKPDGLCSSCSPSVTIQSKVEPPGAPDDSTLASQTRDFKPDGETQAYGGKAGDPVAEEPAGDMPPTLGRFQPFALLGKGAFGKVYRAYDPLLDREVALKVPRFSSAAPEVLDRFLREARAAGKLQHPNILSIFDCGLLEGGYYIASELIEGQTLAALMATGRISFREAARWARDLALALDYANQQGIAHRDVKPANIMIDRNRRARLMDFGLARRLPDPNAMPDRGSTEDPFVTQDGTVMGTPPYMAPEQARGEVGALGPLSDQYSLGVVLYEMLTRERPFKGNTAEILAQVANPKSLPRPPRDINEHIPLGLQAIVWKAMRKRPGERYISLADMAVDLQRWLKGDPVEAPVALPEAPRGDNRIVTRPPSGGRKCPSCGKTNGFDKPRCMYCGTALAEIEENEEDEEEEGLGSRRSRSERLVRSTRRTWFGRLKDQQAETRWARLFLLALILAGAAFLYVRSLQPPADEGVAPVVIRPDWDRPDPFRIPDFVTAPPQKTFWEKVTAINEWPDLVKGVFWVAVGILVLFVIARSRH